MRILTATERTLRMSSQLAFIATVCHCIHHNMLTSTAVAGPWPARLCRALINAGSSQCSRSALHTVSPTPCRSRPASANFSARRAAKQTTICRPFCRNFSSNSGLARLWLHCWPLVSPAPRQICSLLIFWRSDCQAQHHCQPSQNPTHAVIRRSLPTLPG